MKGHQDSSVVQVSDSIKYKKNKQAKKTFVSMLVSGASIIYIYYIYIYIGFVAIDSRMLCSIVKKTFVSMLVSGASVYIYIYIYIYILYFRHPSISDEKNCHADGNNTRPCRDCQERLDGV